MSGSNIFLDSTINGRRRCAACKFLRKKCKEDCTLAPYFPPSQVYRFSCVRRIFGASNITRMLKQVPAHLRAQAADSFASEAYWRVQDPVYGCTAIIDHLQHEIQRAQIEIWQAQAQLAFYKAQANLINQPARPNKDEAYWAIEDDAMLLPDLTSFPPDLL
ncbi:LOB domain-containing protein 24 [Apostasia shenzhenica]|uniref:LOB domain-containing protein 24 n=1 Tax=Apostasia shenzhenica TaxID=1088818 RepID=A0A2I0AM25_9ASPA|nr:LOB domain-containing protein 24 [Apostasia shenzhenica]